MASAKAPLRFQTISAFHHFRGLPPPEHPLFSIIDVSQVKHLHQDEPWSLVTDFYVIGLKRGFNAKLTYGQQEFDFEEGILSFTAPGRVFTLTLEAGTELTQSGSIALIHPDFLWNTPLAGKIKHYAFFDYALHEALFLSAKEEAVITGIIANMNAEYGASIDVLSRGIIISQLETLLAYSERFYQRQFITRVKGSHHLLTTMQHLLAQHFERTATALNGLPTVAQLATQLNVSPGYLGDMLRALTGMNTQQHIHHALIEKAKELLGTTRFSVSEISFQLGFEHIQSFTKLFKSKTRLTPSEFRHSVN